MKPLTLREIEKAVCGRLNNPMNGEKTIDDISIDSRQELQGKLFIPIVGEKFDGHDFIKAAFAKGAECVLSEKPCDGGNVIFVQDTKEALKSLAAYYRGLFDIKVVAITGSTGKTTTKDMIASVLGQKYKALKTMGNFNNEIGLPLTILRLDDSIEVAVVEMGMSAAGEIHNLSKIAQPDYAVITNIGVSHIENFGTREGICKAKCEIFDYLKPDGKIYLNGDDDMLYKLDGKMDNIVFYGMRDDNGYYPENTEYHGLSGASYWIRGGREEYKINVPVPGAHMVANSLAAAAIAEEMGLSSRQIVRGIKEFQPSAMRMNISKTDSGITVINDAYNASPISVKAALDVLCRVEGRKVCVLGDMFELGEKSKEYHYETGVYAAALCIDSIICIGNDSEHIYDGVLDVIEKGKSDSQAFYFRHAEELMKNMDAFVRCGDTVLVKASRAMGFEKIIEKIIEVKNE